MRELLGTLAIAALVACNPPPPQYPEYRYGNDPAGHDSNPPPAYSNNGGPPTAYPSSQPPPPTYTSTSTQPGFSTSPPPPGATAVPPGYTSTANQPGYAPQSQTAPPPSQLPGSGQPPPMQPQPSPPPLGGYPGTTNGPGPSAPVAGLPAGQYACWQVGMGGYVASNLGSVSLNPDSSYQVAGYKNAGGGFRADSVAVYMTGGPLNGWVGAIGANAKGPLVRFRPDAPNNPGPDMRQGDQLCFLHF